MCLSVAWWPGGGGAGGRGEGGQGALKFISANVKYCTKYVKSSLTTNSKIVVILAFYSYSIKQ